MTYIYLSIRRELWEAENRNPLTSYRSIKDIWKLSTFWTKLVLLIYMVSLVGIIITFFYKPNSPLYWISISLQLVSAIYFSLSKEKILYKHLERNQELQNLQVKYEDYIRKTNQLLSEYNINSNEKINLLKDEAEIIITKHNQKYDSLNSKIFSAIITPLISLILVSMNDVNSSVNIVSSISFLIVMFVIYQLNKIFRFISYHTDGLKKDEYLLNTLNELDYQ